MRVLEDMSSPPGLPGDGGGVTAYKKVKFYYTTNPVDLEDSSHWYTKEVVVSSVDSERTENRRLAYYSYVNNQVGIEDAVLYGTEGMSICSIYIPSNCIKIEIYNGNETLLAGALFTPIKDLTDGVAYSAAQIEYTRDKTLTIYSTDEVSTDEENILKVHSDDKIKPHYEETIELSYLMWEDSIAGKMHFQNALLRAVLTHTSDNFVELDGTTLHTGDALRYGDSFQRINYGNIAESTIIKSDGSILNLGDIVPDDLTLDLKETQVYDGEFAYWDAMDGNTVYFKY